MSDNSKGKRKETEDSKREQEIKKWEDILKSTNFQDVLVSPSGHSNNRGVLDVLA